MQEFNCLQLRDYMESVIQKYVKKCDELQIVRPVLSVISVGEDEEIQRSLKFKESACKRTGIPLNVMTLNEYTTQDWLIKKIKECNNYRLFSGIALQFPLKSNHIIDDELVLNEIDPDKDVQGLTPVNMFKLAYDCKPTMVPCTAKSVVDILRKQLKVDLEGKHVVILGRGKTSGIPLSSLLPLWGATISIIDDKTTIATKQLLLSNADIIISCEPFSLSLSDISLSKPYIIINVENNHIESFREYANMTKQPVDLPIQVNTLANSVDILAETNLLFNTCVAHLINNVEFSNFSTLVEILDELF